MAGWSYFLFYPRQSWIGFSVILDDDLHNSSCPDLSYWFCHPDIEVGLTNTLPEAAVSSVTAMYVQDYSCQYQLLLRFTLHAQPNSEKAWYIGEYPQWWRSPEILSHQGHGLPTTQFDHHHNFCESNPDKSGRPLANTMDWVLAGVLAIPSVQYPHTSVVFPVWSNHFPDFIAWGGLKTWIIRSVIGFFIEIIPLQHVKFYWLCVQVSPSTSAHAQRFIRLISHNSCHRICSFSIGNEYESGTAKAPILGSYSGDRPCCNISDDLGVYRFGIFGISCLWKAVRNHDLHRHNNFFYCSFNVILATGILLPSRVLWLLLCGPQAFFALLLFSYYYAWAWTMVEAPRLSMYSWHCIHVPLRVFDKSCPTSFRVTWDWRTRALRSRTSNYTILPTVFLGLSN